MDALSDPKGYLSAQEKEQAKRAEALAKIGIDETEIDTTNVIQSKGMYIYLAISIFGWQYFDIENITRNRYIVFSKTT